MIWRGFVLCGVLQLLWTSFTSASVSSDFMALYTNDVIINSIIITTGAVLGRHNSSSEQLPPNMAAANFVVIANGEGWALNETAVAAVLIDK